MCPPMRANTENTSTGGLLPPVDFIYIASLLNRHGISCNPCHAVKARHCLVCHATPRVMVPDSRGCGAVGVKRRNTLCLGDCQENTTLSGGDQPPSPRKSSGLVDDCRLRPVCLSVSKGEQYIAFPTDTRFQTLEPHIPGRLPTLGPALNVGYLQLVICREGGK